jgi:hypothetical protein
MLVRRPVLGAFAGFFFGLFLGTTLLMFGIIPLQSAWMSILPALFIVLGAVWGYLAPLGRIKRGKSDETGSLVRTAAPDTVRPVWMGDADPSMSPIPAPHVEADPTPVPWPETESPPPERWGHRWSDVDDRSES